MRRLGTDFIKNKPALIRLIRQIRVLFFNEKPLTINRFTKFFFRKVD
jgi:hypothetical protein